MVDAVFVPGGAKPLGLERQAFMRLFPCADAADASAVWPLGARFWAQVRTFPWEFTPGTFVGSASALGHLVLALGGTGSAVSECLVQHSSGVVIVGDAADGVAAAAGQSVACFKGATAADRFMVVFPAPSVRVDASGRFATGVVAATDPMRLPLLVAMWMSGIRHVGAPDAATAAAAAPTTVEAELSAAGLLPRLPALMGELAALLRHVRHMCPSPSLHVCARAEALSGSVSLTLAPVASGAATGIVRHDIVVGMLSVPPAPPPAAAHASAVGAASSGAVAGVKRPRPTDGPAAATGGAGVDGASNSTLSGEPAGKRPALDGGVASAPSAAAALPQPRLPFLECGRDFARVRSMLATSRSRGVAAAAAPPGAADEPVSLAIIVPFRDQPEQNRMEQLHRFAAAMPAFLARCRSRSGAPLARYHVFIVEQSNDGFKFNRGKLLNAGYTMAKDYALMAALGILPASAAGAATAASAGAASSGSASAGSGVTSGGFNSFCFHDVDLLPGAELGPLYAAFPAKPIHIGYAWTRYLLPGYQYVGGILTLGRHTMEACNGFPNNFWGWGGEDDVVSDRLRDNRVEVDRPGRDLVGKVTDLEEVLQKELRKGVRASAKVTEGGSLAFKCMWKTELRKFHQMSGQFEGLATLDFSLVGKRPLNEHVTVLTVDLKGGDDPAGERFADGAQNVGLKVSDATIAELFNKLGKAYGITLTPA